MYLLISIKWVNGLNELFLTEYISKKTERFGMITFSNLSAMLVSLIIYLSVEYVRMWLD